MFPRVEGSVVSEDKPLLYHKLNDVGRQSLDAGYENSCQEVDARNMTPSGLALCMDARAGACIAEDTANPVFDFGVNAVLKWLGFLAIASHCPHQVNALGELCWVQNDFE